MPYSGDGSFRLGNSSTAKTQAAGIESVPLSIPWQKAAFFSAVDDIDPDKAFVVYGGAGRYRLKPGIEAISLTAIEVALLARKHGE